MKKLVMRWEVLLLALLVIELIVFGMINPRFLRTSSLLYGTSDFVQVGIVAVPLTLVIIAGGIDVSFASTVGLCAITFGIANFFGLPLAASLAVGFGTGALAGVLNATIIRLTRLQPLVVTLGSLYLFSGAATVLSGVVGANGYEGIGGFPTAFTNLGYAQVIGVPMPL
ncbi:MAG: autoinducer 2 import system permease LsrD, partial [Marinomonas sp.]